MNSPKSIYEFLMSDNGFAQNYSPNTAHDLVFDMRGGRNMEDMITDVILSHQIRGRPTNSFAYIVGGYVDITFREKDRNYCVRDYVNNTRTYYRYEEVTYEEQINESYEKAIYRYAHASNRLKHEGIRPVFATIPPSCLEKWNDYRLYFGNTDFLLHHSQYDNMQQGLMEAIIKINGFICKLNALHHVYTPYLAGTVVKTHAADGRNPVLQRHKLFDGVHADDLLIEEWAGKIKKSINKNRLTPTSNLPSLQYHSSEHLAYILEGITL